MGKTKLELLIEVLLDKSARLDERHDAVMDLGEYADQTALNALVKVASDANEDQILLDSAGESIAAIMLKLDAVDMNIINSLADDAKFVAIKCMKSD